MDTASYIGLLLVIIFLIAVIIRLWKDNKADRRYIVEKKQNALLGFEAKFTVSLNVK